MDFTNKTVLVTGSSRGIGKAIAFAFGQAGARVVLNASRSKDQLAEAKKELEEMGKKAGFSHVALLKSDSIELMPEVREMCKNDICHMYAKRWSCPPGCGDLEVCRKKIEKYREGIIVQTVGKLEDPLDGETMMETEAVHKQNFYEFEKVLRERWPGMLPIGAGCCTKCKTCTYPDAPCRFPEQAFSSMEAYGMLVTQVCQANGLEYYYGPCTIAYTSCYLLE